MEYSEFPGFKRRAKIIKQISRYVRRNLPEPLTSVVRPLYGAMFERDFQVVKDERLWREVMDFLHLSRSEALNMCKLYGKPNAMLWSALNPQTEEEIRRFYQITPFYIGRNCYAEKILSEVEKMNKTTLDGVRNSAFTIVRLLRCTLTIARVI